LLDRIHFLFENSLMNDLYIVLLNKIDFQIEYILMKIVLLLFVYNQEYKHQIEIQMFDESNQR